MSSILRRFPEDVAARLEGAAAAAIGHRPLIEDVTDDGTVVYKDHLPGPPGLSGLQGGRLRRCAGPGVVGAIGKRAGTEMGESARRVIVDGGTRPPSSSPVSVLRTQPRLVPSA